MKSILKFLRKTKKKNKELSGFEVCPRCVNRSHMTVIGKGSSDGYEAGWPGCITHYEILNCPNCKQDFILSYRADKRGYISGSQDLLTPTSRFSSFLFGEMGAKMHCAYLESTRCNMRDLKNYAAKKRIFLEAIVKDKNAKGGTLSSKIDNLAKRGVFSVEIGELAHFVRRKGNIGHHYNDEEVNMEDARMMDKLLSIIIDHVYSVPGYLKAIKEPKE